MIAGMGMYCTLANTLGVVDTLGQAMQTLPAFLIAPCFALLGSALSFVTSAATVQPLMMSMIPGAGTGSRRAVRCTGYPADAWYRMYFHEPDLHWRSTLPGRLPERSSSEGIQSSALYRDCLLWL